MLRETSLKSISLSVLKGISRFSLVHSSLKTLNQLGTTRTRFSSPQVGDYSSLRIGTLCETNLGWSTVKSPCEN